MVRFGGVLFNTHMHEQSNVDESCIGELSDQIWRSFVQYSCERSNAYES